MEKLITEISQDVREIRSHVTSLVAQGAVTTRLLEDSIVKHKELEARIEPIEHQWGVIKGTASLILLVMGSGAIAGAMAIVKMFSN